MSAEPRVERERSSAASPAQTYTSPLATGARLDPIGEAVDLGSMPLAMALAPDGRHLAVVLSGWREQGLQIVDLETARVTQTLAQDAAFFGIAFARDARRLYVSGGNDDSIFCYDWEDGTATFQRRIKLAEVKRENLGTRYPAGLALSRGDRYLYVAENLADSVAVVDLSTDRIVQRFHVGHYPYAVEAAPNGMVYVSAWAGDTVSVFRTHEGRLNPSGVLKVGPRPSALASNASGTRLYVALAAANEVAIVDTERRKVLQHLNDRAPSGPSEGSTPNALAVSPGGSRLFVAEADNNAVAVFDISEPAGSGRDNRNDHLEGRIPTDWYPTGLLVAGNRLLILTGKGHGSGANPEGPTPGRRIEPASGYSLGQLNGDLRMVPGDFDRETLNVWSSRTASANGWTATRSQKPYPPFKHVVYIIKENRTYDQVFGDLKEGDGDPQLVFFGPDVSPNHRELARRFGLFDRFFTNAEVSSQGHIWSTAAYVTDFGEKLIPSLYSDRRPTVDGDDADEPLNGFLWTLAKKRGVTFRDYGEMVKVPEWPVTQKELIGHISPTYPPFNLLVPDQARADAWIAELRKFSIDGTMPQLEVMHLPGDHTAGGRAGFRTPRAYMADNDLALGRIIEALSQSPFWKDTVVFVVEDDAQAGPDHVDSHRSVFLAISAYSRPGTVHRFINTTDVVAAIEDILGLDRLSTFDYFSRSLSDIFGDTPDLSPFKSLTPRADMNELNVPTTAAAAMSETLDLSAPDRVNDDVFNRILWLQLKGSEPFPAPATKAPVHVWQVAR